MPSIVYRSSRLWNEPLSLHTERETIVSLNCTMLKYSCAQKKLVTKKLYCLSIRLTEERQSWKGKGRGEHNTPTMPLQERVANTCKCSVEGTKGLNVPTIFYCKKDKGRLRERSLYLPCDLWAWEEEKDKRKRWLSQFRVISRRAERRESTRMWETFRQSNQA